MGQKNFLDQIINWEIDDLSLLLHLAIKLLYSDGIDSIQEWNVLNLLPALIEMIQTCKKPEDTKTWKFKLKKVESLLEKKDKNKEIPETKISSSFSDKDKQNAVVYFLLYLAMADNKLDPKEAIFLKQSILRPFNWSKKDVISLIDHHSEEFVNVSILKEKITKVF